MIPRNTLSCAMSLVALAFFLVPAVVAGHPFIVRATTAIANVDGSTIPSCSTCSTRSGRLLPLAATALRGGSDDVTVSGEDSAKATAKTAMAAGDGLSKPSSEEADEIAAIEADDELSVEATDEEVTPPEALDGDAVSISADAFIHPAHVRDDDVATAIDAVADDDVAEEEEGDDGENEHETYFSAVEDEDEGSTTPVTPDDEDIVLDASGGEASMVVADDASADADAATGSTIDAHECTEQSAEFMPADEDSTVVDFAEDADLTRQQQGGGYTEDDSAAYVDRMDLADDEGEEIMVDTEESVAKSIVAADPIVEAEEDDGVDPLDLGLAQSTREEFQRQQQAKVAAAAEIAAAATAEDAPPTVQYMITKNMKRVLADELGYTEEEVKFMKPDVAAVITSKRLKRPSGGMPDAFYVDGKAPSAAKNPFKRLLKSDLVQRIVRPALVVGSAAYISAIAIQASADSVKRKESPAAPLAVVEDAASTLESPMSIEASKEKKENAIEEQLEESRLGAFRPDSASQVPSDLDDTFLDRMITRILEKFRFRSR